MIIVICGPTASGKTSFAHNLACKYNGEIICADSKQLYAQLPIITASPSDSLKSELPYLLYNFCDLTEEYSAPKYAIIAAETIKKVSARGKVPIVVGGSGMYINALIYGYSTIPSVSDAVQNATLELLAKLGQFQFFEQLKLLDPLVANKLLISDTQRITRAYAVFQQTGKSIVTWRESAERVMPIDRLKVKTIMLNPERSLLHSICNQRLEEMFCKGVIEEVAQSYHTIKTLTTSITHAIGVQEIISYLDNIISLDEALNIAQARTRQYAKRQVTWFKHQLKDKITINYSTMQELKSVEIDWNM